MKHTENDFAHGAGPDDSGSPRRPDSMEERSSGREAAGEVGRAGGAHDPLAFDPVPLRRRDDGLTPERQRGYVEALADCGVAREAAARIGVSERSVARARRRADARSFDLACEAAHRMGARNVLRSVAFERAIEGTIKRHYYHGELKSEERVYDNRLLVYLVGKAGHLLDPPDQAGAICDNWQSYMDALEHGRPPSLPVQAEGSPTAKPEPEEPEEDLDDERVWLEDGVWWTLFPPPEEFDGEAHGKLGDDGYQRTLTEEEAEAMRARGRARDEAELARCCALRDRFFGLPPRGAPGSSFPREAGPSGPSEPPDPCESGGPPAGADPSPVAFPVSAEGRAPVEQDARSGHTSPDTSSEGGAE